MHSIDAADNESKREFAAHPGFKRAPDLDDATRVVHSLGLSTKAGQKVVTKVWLYPASRRLGRVAANRV